MHNLFITKMSRQNSLLLGIFSALFLIAIGIALAPMFQAERSDTSSAPVVNELIASLPANASANEAKEGVREAASAPATAEAFAIPTTAGTGQVLTIDGSPIPAGTRVVVRLDNPDFLAAMTFGEMMRMSFQRGPAGQRAMMIQARKNRKEMSGVLVGADGKFNFKAPASGDFYLDIQSDGLLNYNWDVYHSSDRQPYIVRARRGVALRGKVISPDGRGVAGADITYIDHRMPGSGGRISTPLDIRRKSGADGSFILPGVPAGSLGTLVARARGFAAGSSTVKFTPDTPNTTITLLPSARVIGRVVSESGDPVEGATIDPLFGDLATYSVEIEREPLTTGPDGTFDLTDIPPVYLSIRASKAGRRPATTSNIDVRPGSTVDAGVFVLKNGTLITGKVVMPDGTPVAEARVTLEFSTQMTQMEPGEGGANIYDHTETTTNSEGLFRMEGMGVGPYDLEATWPGFAPARKRRYKNDGELLVLKLRKPGSVKTTIQWAEDAPKPASAEVILEISRPVGPGFNISENVKSQKFDFTKEPVATERTATLLVDDVAPGAYNITVRAKGFARARVTGVDVKAAAPAIVQLDLVQGVTVSGRAIDRLTRNPLNGARVLVSGNMLDMFNANLPTTATNEEGKFELPDLEPGPLTIAGEFTDHARTSLTLGNLAPGARVQDVQLELGTGGGVEGQSFGEDGSPMAGGIATINAPDRGVFEQVLCDRDGRFACYRLAPGNYQVSVLRGSFISDMGNNPGNMLKGMRFASIEIREAEITKIVLGEERGNLVKVHGKVRSKGVPVAGAIVTSMPQGGGERGASAPQFDTTNAQGEFEVSIPAGRAIFTIQRMSRSQSGCEIPAEIPEKASHELILNLPLGSIDGIVRGPQNEPLVNQPVMLSVDSGPAGSFFGSFGQATTDDEGRFRFENLGAATYLVSAGGTMGFADTSNVTFGRVSKRVEVQEAGATQNVEFTIGIAGGIVGTVTSGGQPLPGASIFLQMPDGQPLARISDVFTNSGGQFKARGVSPGTMRLLARAKGFAPKFVDPVVVESGRETQVSIELSTGAPIAARIVDAEGKPVPGPSVTLTDGEGRRLSGYAGVTEFAQWMSDGPPGPGEVRLGTLGGGRHRITVTKSGYANAAQDFDVNGQEPRTIEIRLNKQ